MTFKSAEGPLEALQNISFDMEDREFICVLGPSGSGKSTLLRLIASLLTPTSGTITFQKQDSPPKIGLVFQQANLMPWRTTLQNILLPLELNGIDKLAALARAKEMIHLVGLEEFSNAWPAELSGGMAQRVAIARAFIAEPDLLLLDEPFGSLDALTREKMGDELLRIWQGQRKAVVMVTHSISEALLLSDRIILLTPRPGNLVIDLKIDFPRPRQEDLRYTPEFQLMEKELRKAIR